MQHIKDKNEILKILKAKAVNDKERELFEKGERSKLSDDKKKEIMDQVNESTVNLKNAKSFKLSSKAKKLKNKIIAKA